MDAEIICHCGGRGIVKGADVACDRCGVVLLHGCRPATNFVGYVAATLGQGDPAVDECANLTDAAFLKSCGIKGD